MQALTNDIVNRWPGVVVYGIRTAPGSPSDHYEDDRPGTDAPQTDADSNPEHRAIDVMIGGNFTFSEANAFVTRLVADPASQARLYYVIFNEKIWSRSNGWVVRAYTGSNPHKDHPHISGWAADDENASSWPIVFASPGSGPVTPPPNVLVMKKGDTGPKVKNLQIFFRTNFSAYRFSVSYKRGQMIVCDGDFGPQTEAWVMEFQRRVGITQDGIVGPNTMWHLKKHGYRG